MQTQAALAQNQAALETTHTGIQELRTSFRVSTSFSPSICNFLQEMSNRMDREDRLRYTASKANLMTSFVKKLSVKQKVNIPQEAKNNPLHDNTKYMNAASTLFNKYPAQEFKDRTGLDPAYRILLQNYRKLVEARHKWAHETDDEFARLLLSRQFQEEPFKTEEHVEQWGKLLLWVTGKDSLEEIADTVAQV